MDTFTTQHSFCSRYLVVMDGDVFVYEQEKCNIDQPFLSFHVNFFLGNSKICQMTEFSGAGDHSDFDGNAFLPECEDNEHVCFSGLDFFKIKNDDKIIEHSSLTGSNMVLYTFTVGELYTYLLPTHSKVIENEKIEEGTSLNATKDRLEPFEYHLGKKWCKFF